MTIALHPASENGPKSGTSESMSIGLGVGDLDMAMAELKGKAVAFDKVVDDAQ